LRFVSRTGSWNREGVERQRIREREREREREKERKREMIWGAAGQRGWVLLEDYSKRVIERVAEGDLLISRP